MTRGFVCQMDKIVRLGHAILSSIIAAYEFDNLHREFGIDVSIRDSDIFDHIRSFEDDDFIENLISIAILARVMDDGVGGFLNKADKLYKYDIGYFISDGSVLTSREACNKIIHAKELKISYEKSNMHPITKLINDKTIYITPILSISGEIKGKSWGVKLNLIPFVLLVVNSAAWA